MDTRRVLLEVEEDRAEPVMCEPTGSMSSGLAPPCHVIDGEVADQKKTSTSPRGSILAPKCYQLNLYRWVRAYPQNVIYSKRDDRWFEEPLNPTDQSELRGLSGSTG